MPKLGDALKRAVEDKPGDLEAGKPGARPSSVLMNGNRRRVFQYLCANPCSGLGRIAVGASLSRSAAKWHLRALAAFGYVREFEFRGKPHYCPSGLMSARNQEVFALLTEQGFSVVYWAVLGTPGSDAGTLATALGMPHSSVRRSLRTLREVGLLDHMADGRYVRYFPTERYGRAVAEERQARKGFIRQLMRKLSAERLGPKLEDLKGPDTVISISLSDRKDTLVIPAPTHRVTGSE